MYRVKEKLSVNQYGGGARNKSAYMKNLLTYSARYIIIFLTSKNCKNFVLLSINFLTFLITRAATIPFWRFLQDFGD